MTSSLRSPHRVGTYPLDCGDLGQHDATVTSHCRTGEIIRVEVTLGGHAINVLPRMPSSVVARLQEEVDADYAASLELDPDARRAA